MLPALPADKISARGAAMPGAAKGAEPSGDTPGRVRGPVQKRARGAEQKAERPDRAEPAAVAAATALPPVREGEDEWTLEELQVVRSRLVTEIDELAADIALSESQIADGDSSDGAGDDQADLGTKTYTREHEMSLTLNARDLLAQNERAMQRIDAGTYGPCESCGNAIGKARLQAFPRATLCVTCKQREERR